VVLAVEIRPWWLTNPASAWEKKNEVRTTPSALATVSTLLALCALLLVVAVGLRRRRVELWSGALIALALCAGLAAVAAATPTTPLLSATLSYTMWLGSPVGMFVWLLLGWALVAIPAGRLLPRRLTPALASAAGVVVVGLAAASVAAAERPDEHLLEYRPLGTVFASLDRGIPSGRTVRLLGSLDMTTFRIKMAARYELLRHGIRPLSPGINTRLGSWYDLGHQRYDCTVYLEDGSARPDRRAASIASVAYSGRFPVSVWVSPAGCPRRAATGANPGASP
jgi:hypothetical protein